MALALSVLLLAGSAAASSLRGSAFAHAQFLSSRESRAYTCSLASIPTNAPSTACANTSSGGNCTPTCNSGYIPSTSSTSLVSITTLSCSGTTFSPTTYSCFLVPSGSSLTSAEIAAIYAYVATLSPSAAVTFAEGIGAGWSLGSACAATCVNSVATGCSGQTSFGCSECVTCSRRAGGDAAVVCAGSTTAQVACFRAAVCAGVISTSDTCTVSSTTSNVTSSCPSCHSGSKKGLLGLLGLLGIIPCVLLLCSSSLLCLLLLRRKKTAAEFYPVGTTEIAAPAIVHHQPTVVYEPHCAPVGCTAPIGGFHHSVAPICP